MNTDKADVILRLHSYLKKYAKTKNKEEIHIVDLFYKMSGWDEEGRPSHAKLYELDLGWIIN